MEVLEYIIAELEKKSPINDKSNVESLDFFENGYIDSMGLIQFIIGLEEKFGIEFSDEEMQSKSFRIVGELTKLIEEKVRAKL